MKRFIKISIVFFFCLLSAYAILSIFLKKEKNYNSAFVDKLSLLKKYKNQKKIILIGGSAIGWGVSAEFIEKQTGIKTINLGHYASFGFMDYQEFIIENMTKEDIVIFSPEWYFYFSPRHFDDATLDDLIKNNIEYGFLINNYKHILRSLYRPLFIPKYFSLNYDKDRVYRYNCFNNNGDIVSHCDKKPTGPKYYQLPDSIISVNQFKDVYSFLNTIVRLK